MNRQLGHDEPIKDSDQDLFNFTKYAKALSTYIRNCVKPTTISIQGPWGSGKTSLMNLIDADLCDGTTYQGVYINAWQYFVTDSKGSSGVDRLCVEVINQLVALMNQSAQNKVKADKLVSGLTSFLSKAATVAATLVGLNSEGVDEKLEEILHVNRSGLAEIQAALSELLQQNTDLNFVFFIDDLDRVDPLSAIQILEVFKNMFQLPRCVFIMAIDHRIVESGLRRKLKAYSFDENPEVIQDYFDKLFQLSFTIPLSTGTSDRLITELLGSIGYVTDSTSSRTVRYMHRAIHDSIGTNPRKIKKLVNAVNLSHLCDTTHILSSEEARVLNLVVICLQQEFGPIYEMLLTSPDYRAWKGPRTGEDQTSYQSVLISACENNRYLARRTSDVLDLFLIMESIQAGTRIPLTSILELSSFIATSSVASFYDATQYTQNSTSQFTRGNKLVARSHAAPGSRVLDIGCGDGRVTLQLFHANPGITIDAFDFSQSQINAALDLREANGLTEQDIRFFVCAGLEFRADSLYDLVFSSSAIHWIGPQMYDIAYAALKPNGSLLVHQGGRGTYQEMHACARQAIKNLGLEDYYRDWTVPLYYPTREAMVRHLTQIGFTDVSVELIENDGSDAPNLYKEFAVASLVAYYDRIPDEYHSVLEQEYLRLCAETQPSKTAYGLWIEAVKPAL